MMKLVAQSLACVRGGRTVFAGVSFAVAAGGGLMLTGPNGAGKSSLLRLIAGLLPPARGELRLEESDPDTPRGQYCHFLGHQNGVKRALTARENLDFWARYLGAGTGVEAALELYRLTPLADIPAGLLSAGQARRLALARLTLGERPVWLLDEPGVSLDADSLKLLGQAMRAHMRGGGLVVAATHTPLGVTFTRELWLGGGGAARKGTRR